MIDILENKTLEIKCLDKGFCRLVDCMPRLVNEGETCDHAITQMARVSYGGGTKTQSDDRTLIRYLIRKYHSSPLESVEFKFHMKLPIMCCRQIIRHRTASVNEISGRYSILKDEFYIPENFRKQSKTNKQGSEETLSLEESAQYQQDLMNHCKESREIYEVFLDEGITREQARMVLPPNVFSEWYWKCDLNNILKFLSLRCDSHAQWETRQYADAMLSLIKPLIPWTIEAWEEYNSFRNAVLFTEKECKKLASILKELKVKDHRFDLTLGSGNKREDDEWIDKLYKLAGIARG